MSEAPQNGWQCPACERQIPRHVEVCRCGSERKRLEALGYKFGAAPPQAPPPAAAARHTRPPYRGPAAALIGYRIDTDLAAGWRAVLKGLFTVMVIAAGAMTARYTYTDPPPTRENVQVLTTLEDYVRGAGPDASNTIPAFLASAGTVGVLAPAGEARDLVKAIDETELRRGFCSQNIAGQVRHEYPGYYDKWPDDKLERTVLKKYPEYADRLCVLSIRLDAAPDEIVKYELKPPSLARQAGLWLRGLLAMLAAAVVCLNAYYRVIIGRLLAPRLA